MNLLLTLAIVLGVLVLVRIANIAQLASDLSGENEEDEQDKANVWNSWGFLLFMLVGLFLSVYTAIEWMTKTLPVAASEHGVDVDKLMDINWLVLIIVFFITQFLLFWFAFRYRYNRNRRSFYFHDNNRLEVIWTAVPTVVLAGLLYTGLVEWNKITDRALCTG
ncbi:MAG: cytochrome c oxidase subunit II transmembrane domain-containing protein, partial [Bacteroidota bacterium]